MPKKSAASETPVADLTKKQAQAEWARRPVVMIAGLVGKTAQAVQEAQAARGLGYHAGLLSLAALPVFFYGRRVMAPRIFAHKVENELAELRLVSLVGEALQAGKLGKAGHAHWRSLIVNSLPLR